MKGRFKLSKKQIVLLSFCVLTLAGIVLYLVLKPTTPESGKQHMLAIQKEVSKHILVPTNEEPTLGTVEDKKSLTDAFLKANAEDGDKVLVYTKAKKVYIYRPSLHKLVAVGPLVISASAAEVSGTKIRVRNGSNSDESLHAIEEKLKANYKTAVLQPSDASARKDYPTTIVIDLTGGDKYNFVSNIAQTIGASRGILPAGEVAPTDADILIITGVE